MAESKRSGDEVHSIIADIVMAIHWKTRNDRDEAKRKRGCFLDSQESDGTQEDIPFQFSLIYKNLLRNISILSMIKEN